MTPGRRWRRCWWSRIRTSRARRPRHDRHRLRGDDDARVVRRGAVGGRTYTWWRTLAFGAAVGAAVSARLSAIGFVGAALAVCYVVRWVSTRTWKLPGFAAPRHTIATLATAPARLLHGGVGRVPLRGWPAARRWCRSAGAGVSRGRSESFLLHGSSGHPTFLLGTPGNRGWWYYFPVALLVKTPLPILLCAILGAVSYRADDSGVGDWTAAVPLCSAAAIVALSMTVHVDLGVRLVLPVYPLAGDRRRAWACVDLWRERPDREARGALVALLAAGALVAVLRLSGQPVVFQCARRISSGASSRRQQSGLGSGSLPAPRYDRRARNHATRFASRISERPTSPPPACLAPEFSDCTNERPGGSRRARRTSPANGSGGAYAVAARLSPRGAHRPVDAAVVHSRAGASATTDSLQR